MKMDLQKTIIIVTVYDFLKEAKLTNQYVHLIVNN